MEERTGGFKPVNKKKGSFNIVDFFLILIAIAVLFVVFFVIDPFSINLFDGQDREVALTYTIRIDNVEEMLIEKIKTNDEVVDATVKSSLGYVIYVDNDNAHTEYYYDSEKGEVRTKEHESLYDLEVTIKAKKATFTEGEGYKVNGRRVAVGTQFYLMFPEFLGSGTCISINEG